MWIAIRDAFSRGDQDIYEECIRGEEAFSEEYGETLRNEILPEDVKEVVRKQKNSVDQALATLRTMEGFSAK